MFRNHAIKNNIEIDDAYRNKNGINMRLQELNYIYSDGKYGLKNYSQLERSIVEIQKNYSNIYNQILNEAKKIYIDNKEDKINSNKKEDLRKQEDYSAIKLEKISVSDSKTNTNVNNSSNLRYQDLLKMNAKDFSNTLVNLFDNYSYDDSDIKDIEKEKYNTSVNDPIKWYFNKIGKYKLLTISEEKTIGKLILNGGINSLKAKQQLFHANLRLVVWVALKYCFTTSKMDILDLIQEGNIGLLKAINKWNPELGYKFSTYATWWVRQAVTRAILDQSRIIRLPVHIEESLNRIKKAERNLTKILERQPNNKEIAEYLNINTGRLLYLKSIQHLEPISFDVMFDDNDNRNNQLYLSSNFSGENELILFYLYENIREILKHLTQKERDVLILRYGLDNNGHKKTLNEIGIQYGVSRERIRQIKDRAMKKLQMLQKSKMFQELFSDYFGYKTLEKKIYVPNIYLSIREQKVITKEILNNNPNINTKRYLEAYKNILINKGYKESSIPSDSYLLSLAYFNNY